MRMQGINSDALEKDISKLSYYNNLLKEDMTECLELKKEIEKNYTIPEKQESINDLIDNQIKTIINNKELEIELFRNKLQLYREVAKKTEEVFENLYDDIEML